MECSSARIVALIPFIFIAGKRVGVEKLCLNFKLFKTLVGLARKLGLFHQRETKQSVAMVTCSLMYFVD